MKAPFPRCHRWPRLNSYLSKTRSPRQCSNRGILQNHDRQNHGTSQCRSCVGITRLISQWPDESSRVLTNAATVPGSACGTDSSSHFLWRTTRRKGRWEYRGVGFSRRPRVQRPFEKSRTRWNASRPPKHGFPAPPRVGPEFQSSTGHPIRLPQAPLHCNRRNCPHAARTFSSRRRPRPRNRMAKSRTRRERTIRAASPRRA